VLKLQFFRPISSSATNVVLLAVVVVLLLVIRFFIPLESVVFQPIVMELFKHINDNILHQTTVAEF